MMPILRAGAYPHHQRSSRLGAVAGSANFSRSGLYSNIEYADGLDTGSHELQLERTRAAEQIWEVSADWTEEALEILDRLIKPATAEDAMARMISEQKGFEPWLTGGRQEITGHTLYDYQQELTYGQVLHPRDCRLRAQRCSCLRVALQRHLEGRVMPQISGVIAIFIPSRNHHHAEPNNIFQTVPDL